MNTDLADRRCSSCDGNLVALESLQISQLMQQLDRGWQLNENEAAIKRRFIFKGFAKASYLANLCCWLADNQQHHPDISFGWGYCNVQLSTHDVEGLTENDFIWAAKLDRLTAFSDK